MVEMHCSEMSCRRGALQCRVQHNCFPIVCQLPDLCSWSLNTVTEQLKLSSNFVSRNTAPWTVRGSLFERPQLSPLGVSLPLNVAGLNNWLPTNAADRNIGMSLLRLEHCFHVGSHISPAWRQASCYVVSCPKERPRRKELMSLAPSQRGPEATNIHMGKVEADPPPVTPWLLTLKRLSRGTQLRHIQVSPTQTLRDNKCCCKHWQFLCRKDY